MAVLVVEDDKGIRETLSILLKEHFKKRCVAVANNKKALAFLKTFKFDTILLDLALEDGFAFPILEYLKICETKPRVIVVTAVSKSEEHLKRYEVEKILNKPFDIEKIEELFSDKPIDDKKKV